MLSRDSEQPDTADHAYRFPYVTCDWYLQSSRWTRSRCQATNTSGNDVNPEVTAPEFWNAITWFWTTRHRWPRFPWSLVSKLLWSKSHPRKKGRSILSDHARALILPLSRDDIQSRAAEQENRGLVARQPILPEMTKPGSDRARILKCYHVILNNQTPLTTHIADLFACDWYFPRNLVSKLLGAKVSSVKTPKEREVDFERPRALILPLSRDDIQSRAAEQENRGLVARQPILPEMT